MRESEEDDLLHSRDIFSHKEVRHDSFPCEEGRKEGRKEEEGEGQGRVKRSSKMQKQSLVVSVTLQRIEMQTQESEDGE
jgi:hypothetical protein